MNLALKEFIDSQRTYLSRQYNGIIKWDNDVWNVIDWVPTRSSKSLLNFRKKVIKSNSYNRNDLSDEYCSFMKAIVVYQFRKRKVGFVALNNYLIEMKRIQSLVLAPRNENAVIQLTNWHFQRAFDLRKQQGYRNLYDTATNLKVIADTIDDFKLSQHRISFKHGLKLNRTHYRSKTLTQTDDDDERNDSKIPSMELFRAYAECTNNPINEHEEILLRTIDLLIATGQRANEISVIPVDCLIKEQKRAENGDLVFNAHNSPIYVYGIKYFGEKSFKRKIHYLSEFDYEFASHAVRRLVDLTRKEREVAKFQENNPNRLWDVHPNTEMSLEDIMKYIPYKANNGLLLLLRRNNINPIGNNGSKYLYHSSMRFMAGNIEEALIKKRPDHFDFKVNVNGKVQTVLKTSEILSIRFERAFTFKKRGANVFKVYPHRTKLFEINNALGATAINQSIFERRGLTEADGVRISTTSHAFRHWRNTIYHLTGMSNVQQALALGREDVTQNEFYQHTTLKEKTDSHRSYLGEVKSVETLEDLKKAIKSKSIQGPLTKAYHKIKRLHSTKDANEFLDTHANALHITPYGGCTHDFSQTPCIKHLQCWNGCSHLHVTGGKDEFNRLTDLHTTLTKALDQQLSQVGSDNIWVVELKKKIKNLKSALSLFKKGTLSQVFPEGKPLHGINQKTSSVKDEEI